MRYRTPGKGAHLAPGRSLWGRKAFPADGILDHVQQVAGVELGGGAAACEGLDEGAIQRYVGDKLHDLLAAAVVPRGQNAVGSVGPELGRRELLTDNTIGIHDFHPFPLCYITKILTKNGNWSKIMVVLVYLEMPPFTI